MTPSIRTFTGKVVNPFNLKFEDIDILDIAHALSLCNRFAGHTKQPISVAQHSVYVSHLCNGSGFELEALLHDASEAYLGDVTKWVKSTPEMLAYRKIEHKVQSVILDKFECDTILPDIVDYADRVMVRYEYTRGYGKSAKINHPNYPPLTPLELKKIGVWGFWGWKTSKNLFLERFENLTRGSV
jgi:hypothetical protein